MKNILLLASFMVMVAVVFAACSSPTDKGKKVAEKECECSKIQNLNERNECSKAANEEYNNIHREYFESKDTGALKAFEEGYRSHTCTD